MSKSNSTAIKNTTGFPSLEIRFCNGSLANEQDNENSSGKSAYEAHCISSMIHLGRPRAAVPTRVVAPPSSSVADEGIVEATSL